MSVWHRRMLHAKLHVVLHLQDFECILKHGTDIHYRKIPKCVVVLRL